MKFQNGFYKLRNGSIVSIKPFGATIVGTLYHDNRYSYVWNASGNCTAFKTFGKEYTTNLHEYDLTELLKVRENGFDGPSIETFR